MKASSIGLVSAVTLAAIVASPVATTAASALPSDSIRWFWNSNDSDAKAKFKAHGEHIKLRKVGKGHMKVNYEAGTADGHHDHEGRRHTTKDFNHSWKEGTDVNLQVCQVKRAWPDDCSDWKDGEA